MKVRVCMKFSYDNSGFLTRLILIVAKSLHCSGASVWAVFFCLIWREKQTPAGIALARHFFGAMAYFADGIRE